MAGGCIGGKAGGGDLKLHSVGIHSAEELTEIGSKQAVFRLKEKYPGTCVVILYHLEAAIRGIEMKQIEVLIPIFGLV